MLSTIWLLKVGNLHERKIPLKKLTRMLGPVSLATPVNLIDAVSKCAAKIYPYNIYDLFPVILLLTNHETPYNLINIVLSFHPITAFFIITGLWPLRSPGCLRYHSSRALCFYNTLCCRLTVIMHKIALFIYKC